MKSNDSDHISPNSTQHCEVLFHSYGHTVNDYTLKWDRNEKGEVKKKTFLKLKQF